MRYGFQCLGDGESLGQHPPQKPPHARMLHHDLECDIQWSTSEGLNDRSSAELGFDCSSWEVIFIMIFVFEFSTTFTPGQKLALSVQVMDHGHAG